MDTVTTTNILLIVIAIILFLIMFGVGPFRRVP